VISMNSNREGGIRIKLERGNRVSVCFETDVKSNGERERERINGKWWCRGGQCVRYFDPLKPSGYFMYRQV
jgi:hypothetical protein